MVGTMGRVGLFTMSAAVMTGSTVALGWLYATVNGSENDNRSAGQSETAMEESSIPGIVNGYLRQGTYMAKGQIEKL